MKRAPYKVRTHGHRRGSHELATLTYRAWVNMHRRCRRQSGYVGVVFVCDRWSSYDAFLANMGERPSEAHSLDRFPDGAGNYEPGNCRWATVVEQARNRSTNVVLVHPITGEERCASEWATALGVTRSTLHWRLKRWPLERALSLPRPRLYRGKPVRPSAS